MKIEPLFDHIVVQTLDSEEKTKSGIVLPSSAQEKPQMATVIAVGPGGLVGGHQVEMKIKVGDKIIFNKYSGSEFKINNKEVTIMRQSDVLAKVVDK